MDLTAFFKLSYGLYLLSSKDENGYAGCTINTVTQVTNSPAQLMVAVNKDNHTCSVIQNSGFFAAGVLTQEATMDLIGTFGFKTSKEVDKFANFATAVDKNGIKYVTEEIGAVFSCRVVSSLDVGSHMLFVGLVEDSEVLSSEPVMTYSYYHKIKNGRTPKNAPAFSQVEDEDVPQPTGGYRCGVCGYVLHSPVLPEDYICPICAKPASVFAKLPV